MPKEVKYVKQLHHFGCVPACIAMILGKSYEEVIESFYNDFSKEGINNSITREYLTEYDLSVVFLDLQYLTKLDKARNTLHKPFADIHIISVKPNADDELNHSIIMDYQGEIFDPHSEDTKDLDEYFRVDYVLGIFYND
jgi:hypothetical protein